MSKCQDQGARNVLVGGGTGFIGSHLFLKGLPKDTVAVVNLAGQNVMDFKRRWTAGFRQNVYNSRINTTASLAKSINKAQNKPSVFVAISGVGAYKPDKLKEYTEESTCEEFDFFSKLCKKWEAAASLNNESNSHCRIVTIRSGVVLGGPVGDGSQYMPWIHVEDLTNLIMFAIENPKVKGILNGVAPKTLHLEKALNRPAIFPLPTVVLDILLSKERAIMITDGQKVLPKRTQSVGFKYKYPDIESACRGIVNSS
ncbi:hypothetical protein NQ317_014186 [Molorchus minor]|uniref:DUF1731 domain-containing protein n=1 Tax=Molorchus minor TaxID=1323400 RepID=A0ABQ9JJQ7_9CUCU|nr:hypothetical protein NQ317_014186 [Molorchus minor]